MKSRSPDIHALSEGDRWVVLARYLDGESDAEEADAVRRWLEANPGCADLIGALDRATQLAAQTPGEPIDVEAALKRVRARLHEPEIRPRFGAGGMTARWGRTTRWPPLALRAAAALALVLSAALLWRAVRPGHPAAPPAAAPGIHATAIGRTDSIPLSDGSRVVLGPGSRLTVATGYGAAAREVELSGEALFEVRHDEAHPFRVRAGAAEIRDLGTSFTVRSDAEGVRVVVVSGSVLLRDTTRTPEAGPGLTLKAGEAGLLGSGRPVPSRAGERRPEDMAWTGGRLIFRDASLARVRDDLRRWYGIELVIADSSLGSRRLKAELGGAEPPDQVLRTIGFALGVSIERRGDTAIVRPRKAGRRSP